MWNEEKENDYFPKRKVNINVQFLYCAFRRIYCKIKEVLFKYIVVAVHVHIRVSLDLISSVLAKWGNQYRCVKVKLSYKAIISELIFYNFVINKIMFCYSRFLFVIFIIELTSVGIPSDLYPLNKTPTIPHNNDLKVVFKRFQVGALVYQLDTATHQGYT